MNLPVRFTRALQELLKELYIGQTPQETAPNSPEVNTFLGLASYLLQDEVGSSRHIPDDLIALLPERMNDVACPRWQALLEWHRGNFVTAMELLNNTLDLRWGRGPLGWSRQDIERDRVFLLAELANSGDREARDKILTAPLTYPPLRHEPYYRATQASFRHLVHGQISQIHRSPHSVSFGTSLVQVLDRLAEALSAALQAGSLQMISAIRSDLGDVLYLYGRVHNDADLMLHALRLYLLERNAKRLEEVLRFDYQLLYPAISRAPMKLIDSMNSRTSARDMETLAAFLGCIGQYTPEDRVADLNSLVSSCFDYDYEKGFSAVAMRKTLEILPGLVGLLEPTPIVRKLLPLLSQRAVVAGEALRVLQRVRWDRVNSGCLIESVVAAIDALLDRRVHAAFPYPALLAIRTHQPDAVASVESRLINEWAEERKEGAIIYFADIAAEVPQELRLEFESYVLSKIEDDNASLLADQHLSLGGIPRWHLLGGYLREDLDQTLSRFLETANSVVLNPHTHAKTKSECLDVVIWLHKECPQARSEICETFTAPIISRSAEILECSSSGGLFGFTRDRVQLRLDELALTDATADNSHVLPDAVRLGHHTQVDIRADAIRVLRKLVSDSSSRQGYCVGSLLLGHTYDEWGWNVCDAVDALAVWTLDNHSWASSIAARFSDLLDHGSEYVRASVLKASAKISNEPSIEGLFSRIVKRGLRDPHFALRRLAQDLETRSQGSP